MTSVSRWRLLLQDQPLFFTVSDANGGHLVFKLMSKGCNSCQCLCARSFFFNRKCPQCGFLKGLLDKVHKIGCEGGFGHECEAFRLRAFGSVVESRSQERSRQAGILALYSAYR